MVFLRVTSGYDPNPVIWGHGVVLRTPHFSDYGEWSALRAQSRDFLTPWEPTWPADDLTRSAFRRRIRRYQQEIREDSAYPFFIFHAQDRRLLGGITLSNVTRGMTQTATLGYWIGQPYTNRGYMSAAVRAIVPFAFDTLNLHRVEAACLPHNAPSIRLLEKAGFQREGLARGLVRINGRWQDHIVFALLADDARP
jgi:[ribosomal protein S5]-alanine N-acetyltransferase